MSREVTLLEGGRIAVDDADESVYFIQNAKRIGPIKIGHSRGIEYRFSQLQTSSPFPLAIIATIAGGVEVEKELHGRFKHLRLQGEWFQATKELTRFIELNAIPYQSFFPRLHGCEPRKCRLCDCTDQDCRQCIKRTGGECYWIEEDLCSACVDQGLTRGGQHHE
jgi:hypothetical protein